MSDLQVIVDVYRGHGWPDWNEIISEPRYVGAILRCTEGVNSDSCWFNQNWRLLKDLAQSRYADTFFRGAYHFVEFHDDAEAQALAYMTAIEDAGGWDSGDFIPIADVERGPESTRNYAATAAQAIDVTSRFIEKVKDETGQKVIIYGRGAMRDLNIASRMNADYLWHPEYAATMSISGFEMNGWDAESVLLWQYTGGQHLRASLSSPYPVSAPGLGYVDHSVFLGPGLEALKDMLIRRHKLP